MALPFGHTLADFKGGQHLLSSEEGKLASHGTKEVVHDEGDQHPSASLQQDDSSSFPPAPSFSTHTSVTSSPSPSTQEEQQQPLSRAPSPSLSQSNKMAPPPPRINYFSLTERPAGTIHGKAGAPARHRKIKRPFHRAGPTWRLSSSGGGGPGSFLVGTAAYLYPNEAEPPPPPNQDFVRLMYGGFSTAANGQAQYEEAWNAWGPSIRGSSTLPIVDYTEVQKRLTVQTDAMIVGKINDLEAQMKKMNRKEGDGGGGGNGASAAAAASQLMVMQKQRIDLLALKQQRELWGRLLRWRERVLGNGFVGNLPEPIVVKQRTKRQTRSDIKKFEREQKKKQLDREEARKKKVSHYLRKLMTHREDFLRFHKARRNDIRNCGLAVKRFLEGREKKVEREKDNEEKLRLTALKNNNMDEYIRLVEKTRNERLSYLIEQTDAYIHKIADMVRAEREKSGSAVDYYEEPAEAAGEETEQQKGMSAKARSYYAITHRRTEDVMQPTLLKGGELKEYQIAGLQWMVSLYNNHLSGILADEMGLGKTIQSISLITYLMEVKGNLGPFLVVVPLSTMSNWVNEFKKWAPDVLLVQYKGSPDERKEIYKNEMESGQYNVLLTTYDFVMKDKAILRKFEWEYIIVDEGHRMKNTESKFAQTLGSYYNSKRRLLLTGTPLQNNLPELWSLLNFLLPNIFESPDTFDQWFNKPFASFGEDTAQITEEEKLLIIQRLHELLRPFMLRRVKSAVMGQLPTKVEKVLKCDLSGYQRMLYKDIMNKCLRAKVPGLTMNNMMMHLRKCCNHPFLFQDRYSIDETLYTMSGKLELLDRVLPKLKAAGHRILLFSQMTQMLDILEDYFKYRGFRYLRLDGQTSADDREERMYQFNAPDSPYFIFALSTRAGGLGLNLATADTVIFYDSDWNPSMDSQAMDRAHRIGQKNDVRVFRLITNTSVEEKIISRANEKSKLTNLVVEAGKFNRDSKETERRAMVESLLRDAAEMEEGGAAAGGGGGGGITEESNVPDDEQLNDMMATNQDELELYKKMDEEREAREKEQWLTHLTAQGVDLANHPKPSRLGTDVPPDAITSDLPPILAMQGDGDGGGGGNGLLMDDEELMLARGRKRKDVSYSDNMTEKQFMRIMEKRADEEEKMKKQSKRKKKGSSLPKEIFSGMFKIYNAIRMMKNSEGRQLSVLFAEKPDKKLYADYYNIIKNPIDLLTIRRKIKGEEYHSLPLFEADFHLLFSNAMTYNYEGSLVYQDAQQMKALFDAEYVKLQAKHHSILAAAKEEAVAAEEAAAAAAGGGGEGMEKDDDGGLKKKFKGRSRKPEAYVFDDGYDGGF